MTEKNPSFADLFETGAANVPPRAKVRVGDKIEATVVQVGKESVFVELPGRRQGFFDSAELHDADGKLSVKEGDRVQGHVVEVSADGEIRLGRTLGKPGSSRGDLVGLVMNQHVHRNDMVEVAERRIKHVPGKKAQLTAQVIGGAFVGNGNQLRRYVDADDIGAAPRCFKGQRSGAATGIEHPPPSQVLRQP